ncbi:hypothetical protein F7198_07610 [Helicobacter pylori]|nr:hypothetical protein [Helicobacter pylori]
MLSTIAYNQRKAKNRLMTTYKLKNAQNENMSEIIRKRSGLKDTNKKIAMARDSQKAFQAFRTQTTLPNRSNLHR